MELNVRWRLPRPIEGKLITTRRWKERNTSVYQSCSSLDCNKKGKKCRWWKDTASKNIVPVQIKTWLIQASEPSEMKFLLECTMQTLHPHVHFVHICLGDTKGPSKPHVAEQHKRRLVEKDFLSTLLISAKSNNLSMLTWCWVIAGLCSWSAPIVSVSPPLQQTRLSEQQTKVHDLIIVLPLKPLHHLLSFTPIVNHHR